MRRWHEAAVAGLSPGAGRAVLLLALSGTSSATGTAAVAALAGPDEAARHLDEARERGVLVQEDGRHAFRHPLLRSTVLELATPAERRAAHAALADALPAGDRARTWHRAESTVGTDDRVADELERLAEADRHRLGYAAASAALERAATLTDDHDLAARRLAGAAHDAFVAGDVTRVRRLVARVLAEDAPDRARGEALFTLGMLEQYAGSVPRSVEHLDAASRLLDGPLLVRVLTELAVARFRLNDVAGMVDCAHRIDAVADTTDPEQQLLAAFTGGVALVLTGDPVAGVARLDDVRRLADLPALRHDALALLLMALSSAFTGQVEHAVAAGTPRLEELRRRGSVGVLVPLLAIRASGRAWLGDHTGAFADAGEAAELAQHLGYAADAVGRRGDARLAAGRAGPARRRPRLAGPGPDAHRPGGDDDRRRAPGPDGGVLRRLPRRPGRDGGAARGASRDRRRRGVVGRAARDRAAPGGGLHRSRAGRTTPGRSPRATPPRRRRRHPR